MSKRICVCLIMSVLFFSCRAQKPLAFPGAEGFGKFTKGGRGGKVIQVTNLNDSGPGSLREAVKIKEPRTIVFTVSGTIPLESQIVINNGNLTIAGQSAPGDGICIKNFPVVVQADEVIIRFIRFRMGDEKGQQDDALSGSKGKSNIIIDHCSIGWATDECASFYRNKNFTMQWCMITESLNASVHEKGNHGYGGIWGGEGATFHHNLIAHHNSRLPRFSGSSTTPNGPNELVDFRNNVIYNWMSNNTYGGEKGKYNMVSNYYKPGPASKKAEEQIVNPSSPYGRFFLNQNFVAGNEEVSAENKLGVHADYIDSALVHEAFKVESIKTDEAAVAYEKVLKYVGASLRRDAVDARIIKEVETATATKGKLKNGIIDSQSDVGGWPELKSFTPSADEDRDGMADEWEVSHGLSSKNSDDARSSTLESGYNNLEVYLNQIVKSVVP